MICMYVISPWYIHRCYVEFYCGYKIDVLWFERMKPRIQFDYMFESVQEFQFWIVKVIQENVCSISFHFGAYFVWPVTILGNNNIPSKNVFISEAESTFDPSNSVTLNEIRCSTRFWTWIKTLLLCWING